MFLFLRTNCAIQIKQDKIQIKLNILIKSHLLTDPNAGQKTNSEIENFKLLFMLKIINKELNIIEIKKNTSIVKLI